MSRMVARVAMQVWCRRAGRLSQRKNRGATFHHVEAKFLRPCRCPGFPPYRPACLEWGRSVCPPYWGSKLSILLLSYCGGLDLPILLPTRSITKKHVSTAAPSLVDGGHEGFWGRLSDKAGDRGPLACGEMQATHKRWASSVHKHSWWAAHGGVERRAICRTQVFAGSRCSTH